MKVVSPILSLALFNLLISFWAQAERSATTNDALICQNLLVASHFTISPLQVKTWTMTGPKTTTVLQLVPFKNLEINPVDILDLENEVLHGWTSNRESTDLFFSIQGYQIRVPQNKNTSGSLQILANSRLSAGFYIAIKSNPQAIQSAKQALLDHLKSDKPHTKKQLVQTLFNLFTSSTNNSQTAVSFVSEQNIQPLVIGEITEEQIKHSLNRIYKNNSLRNPNLLAAGGFVAASSVLWYILIDGFIRSLNHLNHYSNYIQP